MAKIPSLKIYRSKWTEAVAYSFVTEQIFKNFYKDQGFYVLPEYVNNDCAIVYPRTVPDMSSLFKYPTPHQYNVVNPKSELINLVVDKIPFDRNRTLQIEKEIANYFENAWKSIYNIVPDLLSDIDSVEIYPTQLGSICFEYTSVESVKNVIKIFPRLDCSIAEIFKMIIVSRLRRFRKKYAYGWMERMIISEFLINNTAINRKLNSTCKIMSNLNKVNKNQLRIISDRYLAELGFINYNDLSIKQNKIYAKDNLLHLPAKENIILMLLIKNSGNVVTYEEIAKKLWGNNWVNQFSLEGIVQVIKRIRYGLKEEGINRNIIQCVYKRGYTVNCK